MLFKLEWYWFGQTLTLYIIRFEFLWQSSSTMLNFDLVCCSNFSTLWLIHLQIYGVLPITLSQICQSRHIIPYSFDAELPTNTDFSVANRLSSWNTLLHMFSVFLNYFGQREWPPLRLTYSAAYGSRIEMRIKPLEKKKWSTQKWLKAPTGLWRGRWPWREETCF